MKIKSINKSNLDDFRKLENEEKKLEEKLRRIKTKKRELKKQIGKIPEEKKYRTQDKKGKFVWVSYEEKQKIEKTKVEEERKEERVTAGAIERKYAARYAIYNFRRDCDIKIDLPKAHEVVRGKFFSLLRMINTGIGTVQPKKLAGKALKKRSLSKGNIAVQINGKAWFGRKQTPLTPSNISIISREIVEEARVRAYRNISRSERFYEGEEGTDKKIQDTQRRKPPAARRYRITALNIQIISDKKQRGYYDKRPLGEHRILERGQQ